jgi:hypothetical protein
VHAGDVTSLPACFSSETQLLPRRVAYSAGAFLFELSPRGGEEVVDPLVPLRRGFNARTTVRLDVAAGAAL